MSLLTIHHADIGYKDRVVLHDVAFSLKPGTLCCLLGANGSGKTTLMRTILGLLPPLAGEIRVENTPLASMCSGERARRIGWVPQAHDGAFAFSVLDMVLMGLSPHLGTFARPGERERDLACAQLKALGILPLAQRNWATLSGGERQLTRAGTAATFAAAG